VAGILLWNSPSSLSQQGGEPANGAARRRVTWPLFMSRNSVTHSQFSFLNQRVSPQLWLCIQYIWDMARVKKTISLKSPELDASIQVNSVHFVQPKITNDKLSPARFTICAHSTSLTFDLSHRIRKNSQKKFKKQPFRVVKKWRRLQESNRGGPLSRMERGIDVMWPEGSVRRDPFENPSYTRLWSDWSVDGVTSSCLPPLEVQNTETEATSASRGRWIILIVFVVHSLDDF